MIIKGFKFKNGDVIAAQIETAQSNRELMEQEYLELYTPIEFVPFKFADPGSGQIVETISMSPFVAVAKDSSILVRSADVLTITNLHEAAEKRYLQFIERLTLMAAAMAQGEQYTDNDDYDDEDDDYSDIFDDMDTTTMH